MDQNLQNGTVPPETPAHAADKNTSALVLGLLSFFLLGISAFFLGIPTLVMSIISIKKVVKYKNQYGKLDTFSAIALVGAIMGLVFSVIELVYWVIVGLIFVFPFILLFFGALFA